MRIFYKYTLLIVLLIAFLSAPGQKNKSGAGYIVTLQNDTIAVTFKSRNWKKQPFEIKVSIGEKDSIITSQKIKGFFLPSANIKYESKLISPALYELNMQFAIGNDYKPFFDSARYVFARTLYKGRISLYLYKDPIERNHFFISVGDELTEVYKHLYSTAGGFHNSDPIVEWYNQYLLILKTFMSNCKSLYSIIDAIELNEKQLVNLLSYYDKCMDAKNE